jgi:hypothetical protein
MSELIRWSGKGNGGLVKASDARGVMAAALAKMRGGLALSGRTLPQLVHSPRGRQEIDLPRVCAVHDRFYVARYFRDPDGSIRFGQTFRVTELLGDQYQSGSARMAIPGDACKDETCPWCGARGFGAVRCKRCSAEVCYGRTDAKQYFHCRTSCGSEGRMVQETREVKGIQPYIGPNSGFFSGG